MSLAAVAVAVALQAVPDPSVLKGPHVTLDGLVRRPGGYALQVGDTLGAVLNRAGGLTIEEPPTYILTRTRDTGQVSCLATLDERLETRDNVVVIVKGSPFPTPPNRCENVLPRPSGK